MHYKLHVILNACMVVPGQRPSSLLIVLVVKRADMTLRVDVRPGCKRPRSFIVLPAACDGNEIFKDQMPVLIIRTYFAPLKSVDTALTTVLGCLHMISPYERNVGLKLGCS